MHIALSRKNFVRITGLLLGLAALLWLAWLYRGDVLRGLALLGPGIAWLAVIYCVHLGLAALGWQRLTPRGVRWSVCFTGVWLGASVNTLLPTATIGGEAVKARVLTRHGVPITGAIASVLADTSAQGLSLVAWVLIGVAALLWLDVAAALVDAVVAFAALYALGIAMFTAIQIRGPQALLGGALGRFAARAARWAPTHGAALDGHLAAIYASPWPMLFATLWRTLARVSLTLEVWLAAALMGAGISVFEALVLKSITGAVRGAAFFVPNGIGVQEVAFVVGAEALGVDAGLAVAVSLAVRVRELLLSVPALLLWYRLERDGHGS